MKFNDDYTNNVSKEFQEKTNAILQKVHESGAIVFYGDICDYNGVKLPHSIFAYGDLSLDDDMWEVDQVLSSMSKEPEETAPTATIFPLDCLRDKNRYARLFT